MSEVKWTPGQKAAIEIRDANVLVNAAAGSGKTAVLTQRVIGLLAPEEEREAISAKRLLIVTFTRAAAAEMRARIEKGLKNERDKALAAANIKRARLVSRQIKQLSFAKITTIDAFCQSLVKEYFHVIGIDPSFSITQGAEAEVIKDEVFTKLSQKLFEKRDKSFYLLVSGYCRNGSERELFKLLQILYKNTRSIPNPDEFIKRAAAEYECKNGFENTVWFRQIEEKFDSCCKRADKHYEALAEMIPEGAAWKKVYETVQDDIAHLENIKNLGARKSGGYFKDKKFKNFQQVKEDAELSESIKKMRNQGKELIENAVNILGGTYDDIQSFVSGKLRETADALCSVCLEFSRELLEYKKQNNIFEFSDIEQMAYELLSENETVRETVKKRFDEVLIDEYQDTNELQDSIFSLISNERDMFMVGDMKQSIYRFRNSDPLIFRQKSDSYSENGENRKIILAENFRSRSEVLNSVNALFSCAMSIDVGELEYDDTQRLNCAREYGETGFDYTSECVVIENSAPEDEDTPETFRSEARYIAKRIKKMKDEGFLVHDTKSVKGENGKTETAEIVRPVKNSDFAVLMSSHKSAAKAYKEAFAEAGIECSIDNEGYFVRPEIRLMVSLLDIIENPGHDIPMIAVMRSAAGGFSDEEIARMRAENRKMCFYDILFDVYSKYLTAKDMNILNGQKEQFGKKVQRFCELILSWRDMARYMSAEQLARTVCEQSGLYAFFAAADAEANANLRLFFERAKQYESSGFRGLFTFLRYIHDLEKSSEDLPGANVKDGGDYVKIMTIHKSKGLEMPVVFAAGFGKKFVTKSATEEVLVHKQLGIGINYKSYESGIEMESPIKKLISDKIKAELKSEEIRKLYVALTRAKEKLIVTACVNNNDSKLDTREAGWKKTGLSGLREKAADAVGFIDWVAPAAIDSEFWRYQKVLPEDEEFAKSVSEAPGKDEFTPPENIGIADYKYPHAAEYLKSKAAVSDFKGISHADTALAQRPLFMQERSAMSGAEFGTAVHKIMETLPAEHGQNARQIADCIDALVKTGKIRSGFSKEYVTEKIMKFYASGIGQRLAAAKKVNRESEFEIRADAEKVYNDSALKGEKVLIQGVIDCWFYEGDEIVVLDYKTDRVKTVDEIHKKYDIQLAMYAQALEEITKKKVKEKFIYLFSEDIVIQC